ncbi:dihydrofolate reductase, partial [Candidatus Roizmanbacteria bacterium]|nr:dihydrofolate reductase [Candidatus Roizmanbacteria bacterium]
MKKTKISIIAAMSENRVIGYKDKIPWHIREDLIRFKEKTTGYAMIMGRKSFESLLEYYERSGKPLPRRTNIILTREKKLPESISLYRYNDIHIAHSMEE